MHRASTLVKEGEPLQEQFANLFSRGICFIHFAIFSIFLLFFVYAGTEENGTKL